MPEVTSSGGDVGRHLLCRGGIVLHEMVLHNNTVIMFHLRKDSSASYILAHPENTSSPHIGGQKCYTVLH